MHARSPRRVDLGAVSPPRAPSPASDGSAGVEKSGLAACAECPTGRSGRNHVAGLLSTLARGRPGEAERSRRTAACQCPAGALGLAGSLLSRASAGPHDRSPKRERSLDGEQTPCNPGGGVPHKKLPLRWRRVGMLPTQAAPAVPAASRQHELPPRVAAAQAGQRGGCFVEAAHCVVAPFWGFRGSRPRVCGRAPAGRQRCNVWGALTAFTPALRPVTHAPDIPATAGCDLWRKLAALKLGVPLSVFRATAR